LTQTNWPGGRDHQRHRPLLGAIRLAYQSREVRPSHRWMAQQRAVSSQTQDDGSGLTIGQVMLAYWKFVEEYYRHKDGTPTSEVNNTSDCHYEGGSGPLSRGGPGGADRPVKMKVISIRTPR